MSYSCETLLLGVTGSIGAVNLHNYVAKLDQLFAKDIIILMSHSAQKFTSAYTLQLFTKNQIFTDDFEIKDNVYIPHIELAQKADLFLIMPATANIIGKAAHAICDNLISTTIVACKAPIVFVPSMNDAMWSDKLVQRNINILKEAGYYFLESSEGYEVSDGEQGGKGMPPIDSLFLSLKMILAATGGDGQPP